MSHPLVSAQTTAAMPPTTATTVTITSGHCSGKTAGRPAANVRRDSRRHIAWETVGVEDAFGIVLVVVVVVAALIAVATLAASGRAYDQIGRGGMSLRDEPESTPPPAPVSAAAEREEEIRQMLEARNARRTARGEAPQDVEAELRALTEPAAPADPELRDEVRALVEARNARRAARGEAPLDVEAETERRLRELG
jgi:hypothetical protein